VSVFVCPSSAKVEPLSRWADWIKVDQDAHGQTDHRKRRAVCRGEPAQMPASLSHKS
jgi:hypothetical protein